MNSLSSGSVRVRSFVSVVGVPWLCRLGVAFVAIALAGTARAQLTPEERDSYTSIAIHEFNRALQDAGYDPTDRATIPDSVMRKAWEKAKREAVFTLVALRVFAEPDITPVTPNSTTNTTVVMDASTPASSAPRDYKIVGYGQNSSLSNALAQIVEARLGITFPGTGALTAQGLAGFPATANNTYLTGIAGNGSVAVGWHTTFASALAQPYFVNLPSGLPTLLPIPPGDTQAIPVGVSSDGSVVAGTSYQASDRAAATAHVYRMFKQSVLYDITHSTTYPGATRTVASGLSGDGKVIVGHYADSQGGKHAYQWSVSAGYSGLGALPGQTTSEAVGVNNDGSIVVGTSGQAFSWTAAGGMKPLHAIGGSGRAVANAVTASGRFMAGASYDASLANPIAQLWTRDGDAIKVRDLLFVSGVDVTGWVFNSIDRINTSADGTYLFLGNGTYNGAPRGFKFFWVPPSGTLPTISVEPQAQAAPAGGTAVLSVSAKDATGYQWQRNGANIAGATNATLTLSNTQAATAGSYTVAVSNAGGFVLSDAAEVSVAPTVSRLTNVSVRTTAGTGANTLIVGFTLDGGGKNVLLRAVGPTLGTFGVGGTLDDPRLALFNSAGTQTAQNDDWGGSAALIAAFDSVGAFRLPAVSKDAVLLSLLAAGGYTAQVSGAAGTSGVVLLEVYDSDAGSPRARYTNLSARNQVGTGSNILIVGFNVAGNAPLPLLIRGIGPGLNQFGLTGTLADPQLAIFNTAGTQVNQNDDWGGGATLTAAFNSVGAFGLPASSKDAALSVTLQPGSYTAQVSGVGNTTGVALVEIYVLP